MSITFDIPCDCTRTAIPCPLCGGENFRDSKHDACWYNHEDGSELYLTCVDAERCPHEDLSVNMANSNAADVIKALGLEFDYCGSIDVTDLLGRAGLRAALPADEPVPTSETHEAGSAHMIYCGRPEGYIADRAAGLVTLALRAREDGYTTIQWG